MEQDNIDGIEKALKRLRQYPEFAELIAELRKRRDGLFMDLAAQGVSDGEQRQLIGVMTAYDEIAMYLEG